MTTGADILARTLADQGVDTCFANPGTTEMHLLSALGRESRIALHLCLFEGVATGAADGFARMAERPAAVLLHLGPGLANGMANLHNARKAASPLVNIVGEHATYHLDHDAPLTADIAGMARTVSDLVVTPTSVDAMADATAATMAAIAGPDQRVATMIVPNDLAWQDTERTAKPHAPLPARPMNPTALPRAAAALQKGDAAALMIGAPYITEKIARLAHAIGAATGCRVFTEPTVARMARGGDIPALRRQPFHVDFATEALSGLADAVLVGAKTPVAFFAYPNRPSLLLPTDATIIDLAPPLADIEAALQALADALGATPVEAANPGISSGDPTAAITAETLGRAVASALPEGAIVVDESITNGLHMFAECAGAARHDWLNNRGGSIGYSMPVAVGAAIACPDRPVLCVTGDGSAAYTLQALWSMARARLNVTVVILANRSYRILANEMSKIGAGSPTDATLPLMSLEDPAPDWVKLAEGHGVAGCRVSEAGALSRAIADAMATPGPRLIEATM
ncbi:acetolactate synthase large subunit [Pseudoruegeria sp. SK021]|uniref:acetolactate synthase large subunit n=1 Tax=Pseudoruegeria sp. SK021 TaxID=1933035 RepID=UPI000A2242E8|nr:acetolactate synthase large subunit [Pseudoruegeria sp. SK021]OSP54778.1 acetolactate synthase large subunit [Pseudoruegeria sp. SK021]